MPRYKPYDYDQLLMVPVSLDRQLMPGTLEYAIHELIEEREVDAFIPDRDFRKRDPRFADAQRHRRSVDKHKKRYESKKRWFTPDDFTWDDQKKQLVCPAGKGLGIVEPVFGNIRACKGMDRFTLRSRKKVNIQWTLYCLVHNIGKIAKFGPSYAMAA